jgi:hypothetical protein
MIDTVCGIVTARRGGGRRQVGRDDRRAPRDGGAHVGVRHRFRHQYREQPRMLRAIALGALLATMSPGAATPASAQDQVQAPETETPVEPRRISRAEFLAKIERLIKEGRLDEAMALIARLPDKGVFAFDKRFIAARKLLLRVKSTHSQRLRTRSVFCQ